MTYRQNNFPGSALNTKNWTNWIYDILFCSSWCSCHLEKLV